MNSKDDYRLIISKMSHDLLNPLTAASSTIQLLESKYPEIREDKFFKGLENDLKYMQDLLVDFSQYAGTRNQQFSTFSFDALMKEIVLSFASMASDKELSFSSKIDLCEHHFTGDRIRLQQLFRNLLKNALEATETNGNIFLHAYSEDDKFVISIKDTGCGISKELLPTIFEPFATYNKKNGTGLGLAICKQIVDDHHGTIEVSSVIGKGTTFRIALPTNNEGNKESDK